MIWKEELKMAERREFKHVNGKVVWSNTIEDNEDFKMGFGVSFTNLDEIDREILIQLSEIVNK